MQYQFLNDIVEDISLLWLAALCCCLRALPVQTIATQRSYHVLLSMSSDGTQIFNESTWVEHIHLSPLRPDVECRCNMLAGSCDIPIAAIRRRAVLHTIEIPRPCHKGMNFFGIAKILDVRRLPSSRGTTPCWLHVRAARCIQLSTPSQL